MLAKAAPEARLVHFRRSGVACGGPKAVISACINAGDIPTRVVLIGRARLYFLPWNRLAHIKALIDSRPSRGMRQRLKNEADLSARGLWSTSKSAEVLEVKRVTVLAYARRGWLKPKLRRRHCLGFAPADVRRLKQRLAGG